MLKSAMIRHIVHIKYVNRCLKMCNFAAEYNSDGTTNQYNIGIIDLCSREFLQNSPTSTYSYILSHLTLVEVY